jgi:hypothetical protein
VLQGRVYSISGKDKRFPPLNKAFSGSYANIHPNCRHTLTPYIEAFQDVEKDMAYSNRPFEVEPEMEKSLDKYKAEQKFKATFRKDRNLYEKYKLLLHFIMIIIQVLLHYSSNLNCTLNRNLLFILLI